MRINVYAEELTNNVEVVWKDAVQPNGNLQRFYGFRIYLKSAPDLHNSPQDDDRSAITFWVPWTKSDGFNFELLFELFESLAYLCWSTEESLLNSEERTEVDTTAT